MTKFFKNTGTSLLVLTAALFAASLATSSAQNTTETFNISGFTEIELSTSADLKITIGDEYSVVLTGDARRIENIELDVSGDELEISSNRRFSFFGRNEKGYLNIAITMPNIESMEINGSGDAEIMGVDNDELFLNVNGSGDLYVTGKSKKVDIEINGSGDIEMDEVTGNDVDIEVNGSGNVEFNGGTCDRLEIEVDGSGDIDARDLVCRDVDIDVSGSGNSRVHATERLTFDSNGSGKVDVFGKPKEVVDNTKRDSKIRIR